MCLVALGHRMGGGVLGPGRGASGCSFPLSPEPVGSEECSWDEVGAVMKCTRAQRGL